MGIVLIISLINAVSVSTLTSRLDKLSLEGNVVAAGVVDDEPVIEVKEVQPQQAQPQQPAPAPSPQAPPTVQVSVDDDAVLGEANAPITMIEFSDYECPFCTRFWEQTLPQIKTNYIDTGKVKFVYRDFPLSFHPNAQKAAEAAECAGEQGMYWEMHDKLFETGQLDVSSLKQHAVNLNLDSSQFDSCLDSGKYASEVQKDMQEGASAGVSGTPTFFINGIKVVGAQPYAAFQQVIDAQLG
ncbi:MAG: DsbA family protein [Candidatus Aenigmatarchaeota archaeon]|nr:MAG: DsbA family protein [Candidatus Aenigmarchaeota archaeon]